MKSQLISLLQKLNPSNTVMANCMELLVREDVGLRKYGQNLDNAGLTHEQALQHLLEEQLDGANYIRTALRTASRANQNYVILRKQVEQVLHSAEKLRGNYPNQPDGENPCEDAYRQGVTDTIELLQQMLRAFDADMVLRELRS